MASILSLHRNGGVNPLMDAGSTDLLPRVLQYLDPRQLAETSLVCRRWKSIKEKEPAVWRSLLLYRFPHLSLKGKTSYLREYSRQNKFSKNLFQSLYVESECRMLSDSPVLLSLLSDKRIFSARERSVYIWKKRKGAMVPKKTLALSGQVTAMIPLPKQRIACILNQCTLEIWDIKSKECLGERQGPVDSFVSLCYLSEQQIATGSKSGIIRIRDNQNGAILETLRSSRSRVTALFPLPINKLASGHKNGEILIWDLDKKQVTHHLKGHRKEVTCFASSGDRLFSGSAEGAVRIWDREARCVQVLEGHADKIFQLQFLPNGLLASASETAVKLWHIGERQSRCLYALKGASSLLFLQKQGVLIGSQKSCLAIWDFSRSSKKDEEKKE